MLFARMLRAAMLDQRLYEELQGDPIARVQALTVVLLASLAAVAAVFLFVAFRADADISTPEAVARGLIIMPGVWAVQAASGYFLGPIVQDPEQKEGPRPDLLRAIGYSASPAVLLVFLVIPGLDAVLGIVVPLWLLAAMTVAVKATLNVSFIRGLMSVGPGFLLIVLIGLSAGG